MDLVKPKKPKLTLEGQTGKNIFKVLFICTLLFTGIMVMISIHSLKLLGGTITKYTGVYLARELNSQEFLTVMGINDLRDLDPNTNEFKNWIQNLDLDTIDMKTNDAVIKLQKPLQLINITISDRLMYTNRFDSFAITPFFADLYTQPNCEAEEDYNHRFARYWANPREYPLYAADGTIIGQLKICVDPEIFVILLGAMVSLYCLFILVVLLAARYASKSLTIPIVAPLAQLEARIRSLTDMDFKRSLDSRLDIEHSLEEIESLARATNSLIDKLQYITIHDPLTGTKNRAYYEKEILRLEAEKPGFIGVLICDVDNLKQVNDTKGHKTGDKLLKAAARILQDSLGSQDMLARIGGDEFAIIVYSPRDIMEVEQRRESIKENIRKYNEMGSDAVLGISVGIAVGHTGQTRIEDIFREADRKMYVEKRNPAADRSKK